MYLHTQFAVVEMNRVPRPGHCPGIKHSVLVKQHENYRSLMIRFYVMLAMGIIIRLTSQRRRERKPKRIKNKLP
jgi:hypothetical protein